MCNAEIAICAFPTSYLGKHYLFGPDKSQQRHSAILPPLCLTTAMPSPASLDFMDRVSSVLLQIFLRMIGQGPADQTSPMLAGLDWSEDLDLDLIRTAAVLAAAWNNPGQSLLSLLFLPCYI